MASTAGSITISWSEIDTYRQCPHKHDLTYKQRWTGPTTGRALMRGSLYHKVLEGHYRSLMERPGDLVSAKLEAEKWLTEWEKDWGGEDGEHADLVWWMYQGYIDHYGADDHWDIRGVEQKLEVALPTKRGYPSRFRMKMQIDLIVRDRTLKNRLFIIDHKSGADLPKRKNLDMADQFSFYLWGMRELGHPAFAAIWNANRTTRLKTREMTAEERFARLPLPRTDQELNTIVREAYSTARKAYAATAIAERHPDADTCAWKCGYLDACLLGRKTDDSREREFLLDTGYVQDETRH